MLAARRVLSVPLFVLGGLLLVVGYGGGIAAAIYYEIQAWKLILDGDIVEGVIVGSIVLMLAVTLVNLLNIPGLAFVEGASRLWGTGRNADSQGPVSDRGTDYAYEDEFYDEHSLLLDGDDPSDLRDKQHACPHCGKRMVTPNGVDQHVAAKHPEL